MRLVGWSVLLALGVGSPGPSYQLTADSWSYQPVSSSPAESARVLPPPMTIARLQYDGGGDWYANPSSLPNLLAAIRERTSLDVDKVEARVRLMDDKLWDYPFLHVTGHGNIRLSEQEVVRLREYLARGGFLHVSDNYGIDTSFRREIKRVFPDHQLVDVPLSHPIYHIVYDFPKGLPKIHEHNGKPARGFGIFQIHARAFHYARGSSATPSESRTQCDKSGVRAAHPRADGRERRA